jgi:hypothetical protein
MKHSQIEPQSYWRLKLGLKSKKQNSIISPLWVLPIVYLATAVCGNGQPTHLMLPKVEYQGPIEQNEVPDLKKGVELYDHYYIYKQNKQNTETKRNRIKPIEENSPVLLKLLALYSNGDLATIKYTYPVGVRILFIKNENIFLVEEKNGTVMAFILKETTETTEQNKEGREKEDNKTKKEIGDNIDFI